MSNQPSAFPYQHHRRDAAGVDYLESDNGMDLRDWFAGQALAGMRPHPANERPNGVARWCYEVADAMLAERERLDAAGRKADA